MKGPSFGSGEATSDMPEGPVVEDADELDNASSVPSRPSSQPSAGAQTGLVLKAKQVPGPAPGEGSAPERIQKASASAAAPEGSRPEPGEPLEELSAMELRMKLGLPPEQSPVQPTEQRALGGLKDQLFSMLGQCPKGHRLKQCVPGGGNCDGCARDIAENETVWECEPCDWFLCGSCAPPPQAHAADVPALVQNDDRPKKHLPPVSSSAVFRRLVDEAKNPIEFAALGKLRVWSRADPTYSTDELLDLVEWLEPKLAHPKIVRPNRILWRSIRQATTQQRMAVFSGLGCVVFVILIFFALVMSFALYLTKVATTESFGLITVPSLGLTESWSGRRPAGAGSAVHLRNLSGYVELSNEQLRSMQDVVFELDGAFHFHKVASVARLASGGVRVAGADGAVIRVESDGSATVTGPWAADAAVSSNLSNVSNWTSQCAFSVMTRHQSP